MGEIREHGPALLIVAIISRYAEALAWSRDALARDYGPPALISPIFDFSETRFYEKTMGAGLHKQFWALSAPWRPEELADVKRHTNQLEKAYAEQANWPEARPLNLDPGYITEAKLVLATTKDRDHRIYLREGIFAEVTLHFQQGQWVADRWTYPDYQRPDFQAFFSECRQYLRQHLR